MRLQSKLICLLLFITLSASGWGTVFASVFCTHHGSTPEHAAAIMSADHSCCHAKLVKQEEHCDSAGSEHASTSKMLMPAAGSMAVEVEASLYTLESIPSCAHCLTRSAPVRLNLREGNQAGRVIETIADSSPRPLELHRPLIAAPILTRQGAPPGFSVHRHILNSIFLI